MAEYVALSFFADLQDNGYEYNVGDAFPREGLSVSPERILELSSEANLRGEPVIGMSMPPVDEKPKEEDERPQEEASEEAEPVEEVVEDNKPNKRKPKNA